MWRALRAAAFFGYTWLAHTAWAQEFLPQASLSTIYSDNPLRSNVSTGSAVVAEEDAGLRVFHNGPRFSIDGTAGVAEREFVAGGRGTQTLPNANIDATAVLLPESLTFSAQDSLGQISTQPFDVLDSVDRQTVNYLTAGPDAHFQIDSRDSIILDARYGATTYQHSDINNGRYSGELGLARQIGRRSAVSVNYNFERIQYEHSELFPTLQKQVGFFRYTAQSSRTYLVAEAGEELMKITTSGAQKTTPHATLALQRRVSPLMTFNAEFSHTFSDASEALQTSLNDNFNSGTGNNQNVQASATPYVVNGGYLMLLRTTPVTSTAAQVTFATQRYQIIGATPTNSVSAINALNRKLYGGNLVFDRRMSSLWTLAAQVRWTDTDYTNADTRYQVVEASVGITRLLGRSVQAGLVYQHAHGTGNNQIYGFSENRVSLVISYAPGGAKSRIFDPVNEFRYYERPGRGPMPGQQLMPGQEPPVGSPLDENIPVSPPQ